MKILYAGSPEPSKKTLEILFENQEKYGIEIVGVLSNPPSAKGRHKELTPTPVAQFALEKNIPVFTPEHLDAAAREAIIGLKAELLVCFAYGHIFGPKFLAMFPYGGINLHPSMLPKYRGCTPVPAAILNGDSETGITIQTLSLKMDEGDILAQKIVKLIGNETTFSLLNDSAEIGAGLICEIIQAANETRKLPEGVKQTGEASYTDIIKKEDGKIDWSLPAKKIEAKIRAYFPEPGCWTLENEQPLRILCSKVLSEDEKTDAGDFSKEPAGKVVCYSKADGIFIKTGKGLLCVTELQRQGKNKMNYKDFMNGARNFVGTVLL